MFYREIHIDSSEDGRTSGTKSHPIFHLQDPLYLDYFSVKHITLPLTFNNLFDTSELEWVISEAGNPATAYIQQFAKGNYSALEIATQMMTFFNSLNLTITVNITVGSSNQLVMNFNGGTLGTDIVKWRFLTSINTNGECVILQKLLGYGTNYTTSPEFSMLDVLQPANTLAVKFSVPNFLMLRSNLCRGASFLSNIRGPYVPTNENLGNYKSNILAKVPLNPGLVPTNSVFTYTNNDAPTKECMFTFDGEYTDSFDLFFTYPNDNDEVDFGGYNFSVTISLISSRKP